MAALFVSNFHPPPEGPPTVSIIIDMDDKPRADSGYSYKIEIQLCSMTRGVGGYLGKSIIDIAEAREQVYEIALGLVGRTMAEMLAHLGRFKR